MTDTVMVAQAEGAAAGMQISREPPQHLGQTGAMFAGVTRGLTNV